MFGAGKKSDSQCVNNELSLENLFKTEWLLTNGLGGYASGSVSGANTRSHHGILVAYRM